MSNTDERQRSDEILRDMENAARWQGGLRPYADTLARAESEPQAIDLVKQLRGALGLDKFARSESSQVVWEETIDYVRLNVRNPFMRFNELRERAERAETEVKRFRNAFAGQQARAELAEAEVRQLRKRIGPTPGLGLTDHERRIDRLERAFLKLFAGEHRGGPIGEIAREVAERG